MSTSSQSPPRRRWWKPPRRSSAPAGWRVAVPIVSACAGLLAVTSMVNARGTDLRGGRHTDLLGLVTEQRATVASLRQQATALQREVDALTERLSGSGAPAVDRRLRDLELAAGFRALRGPGLVVTLYDAPLDAPVPAGVDEKLLVVH